MEMDIVIAVANVKELEERTPIINKLRDEVDNFFKNGWNETKKDEFNRLLSEITRLCPWDSVACLSKSTFLIPFFFGDSDDDEIEFGKDKVEEFLELCSAALEDKDMASAYLPTIDDDGYDEEYFSNLEDAQRAFERISDMMVDDDEDYVIKMTYFTCL